MKLTLLSLILFLLSSCSGKSEGVAPSSVAPTPPLIPAPSPANIEITYKYGESKTTLSGWNIEIQHTDPVQQKTLANGWTVEVVHE